MTFAFVPSDEVARIRARLDHPVIDADGHLLEFLPLVNDIVREVAGDGVADRYQQFMRRALAPDDAGSCRPGCSGVCPRSTPSTA